MLEFIQQVDDPHLQAPYFWAGFILSGKDQSIKLHATEASSGVWWAVLGSLLAPGFIVLFARSRRVAN